ncbi:hypothetical protein AJ85_06535 [Alkalihalobacillus alcalophilus ATCC 27647 = CGMCC 1.3604]|uniref:Uncharacterized protein n=1 Tax=Alkalihalobacillus alcalophilus ATCC 27647 = CGMCC 1.3604 TaxID=1218173 RepID=A0A4S4K0S4_ALKAL|nr:hypothetical protein AJ85_06535 [Alkalihalobacillus alcalophilus ATCC 27647 = CGMCC 1.3604]
MIMQWPKLRLKSLKQCSSKDVILIALKRWKMNYIAISAGLITNEFMEH